LLFMLFFNIFLIQSLAFEHILPRVPEN
jgi:hypothetical protein